MEITGLTGKNPLKELDIDRRGRRAVYEAGVDTIYHLVKTFNPSRELDLPISLEQTFKSLAMVKRLTWTFRFLVKGGSPPRDICYVSAWRSRYAEDRWRQLSPREWSVDVWGPYNDSPRERAREVTKEKLYEVIADLVRKADARSPILRKAG